MYRTGVDNSSCIICITEAFILYKNSLIIIIIILTGGFILVVSEVNFEARLAPTLTKKELKVFEISFG